jgi:hypothetical protein
VIENKNKKSIRKSDPSIRWETMTYENFCGLKHDGFEPANDLNLEPDDRVRLFKVPQNSWGISVMLIVGKVSDPRYLTHCRVIAKSDAIEDWIRELYLAVLKRLGDEGDENAKMDAAEQAIVGELPVIHHRLPSSAFDGTEFCVKIDDELDGESIGDNNDDLDDLP